LLDSGWTLAHQGRELSVQQGIQAARFVLTSATTYIDAVNCAEGVEALRQYQREFDDKKQVVKELKAALKDASELYLATDEDREGEAISWHLLEVLKPNVPVKRMVFHEITSEAIAQAIDNWRDLDMKLVEAQEGRRVP
jgi:DNA topoisomerase-1